MTLSSAPRRLIIMPAYNEAGNLTRVIPEVQAVHPALTW